MSTERKYGWKKQNKDSRDFKFAPRTLVQDLPVRTDLRAGMPPVFDQGRLGSCFHPDTKISLLDGTKKTLKDLSIVNEPFWVYSLDENFKVVPGKATCSLTGINKKLLRIILDNEKEILCTPDHKFMKRDGEYIEARELKSGDSLMPLYKKQDKLGYEMVISPHDNKYHKTHNLVAYACVLQKDLDKITETNKAVHHKDYNKNNNSPENLIIMGLLDHFKLHSLLGGENSFKGWNGTERQREHSRQNILKQYSDDTNWNKDASSIGGKKSIKNKKDNGTYDKFISYLDLGHSEESRKKAANSLKITLALPEIKEKQRNIGKKNMEVLMKDAAIKQKYRKIGSNLGGKNSLKLQIAKHGAYILSKGISIDEKNWDNFRKERNIYNIPKFSTAINTFNTIGELVTVSETYNHKVKSIEFITETSDVYCLTVEKYHNFALDCGVFVHNCTANAWSAAFKFMDTKQKNAINDPFIPSRLFIYYNEREMEGTINEDSGAMIRDGAKTLANQGVCDEATLPYEINRFSTKPSDKCYAEALNHQALTYWAVNQDLDTMRQCLADGYPIVIGFAVYEAFEGPVVASSGVLNMPGNWERNLGGHAVLVVGYDDNENRFLVRNSWGSNWGMDGYFTMPYGYLTNRNLSDDFWTLRLVEIPEAPVPPTPPVV